LGVVNYNQQLQTTKISSRLDRTARRPQVGGTKSPEQTPEPIQKVSVWPLTQTAGRVVTEIGPHGGQHVQAVFESDCESNKSVKWAKSPGQTDRYS